MKVSRTPAPWRLITIPSKTWIRWRLPSMTLKCTRTVSPGLEARHFAQLGALELLDDRAHEKAPRKGFGCMRTSGLSRAGRRCDWIEIRGGGQ